MNTTLKCSLAALLLALATATAPAQGRFATVDLTKLLQGYWKTKQVEATINERQAEIAKETKSMLGDYNKAKEEYQKVLAAAYDQAVSAEEREKRKQNADAKFKEMKDLEDTIGQFERRARATLEEQYIRMLGNLVSDIREVVSAKARAAGYTVVLDASADSQKRTPVVLFASAETDLTDSVLKELNANAPKDTARPADKPAEKK